VGAAAGSISRHPVGQDAPMVVSTRTAVGAHAVSWRSRRALDAAGITDPALRSAYETCRRLHAQHGRTYYLATLLLPPAKRPYVWALYGFARYADEFVDSLTEPDPQALVLWGGAFLDALSGGAPVEPVGTAMMDTMRRWDIPRAHVEAFLESMHMDITVTGYPTYADLEHYMYGSAAVIGLQMLPILEPIAPEAGARARVLGEAFQMSNFIRDVGEDLRRGRVYLPQEDLDAFGVTREQLARGVVTAPIRELLRFEVDRTRRLYAFAEPGIDMLHPTSRDCVRTAFTLYGGVLDEVERAGYQVLTQRVSVPLQRRLAVAVPGIRRAWAARKAAGHPRST
jgi:phytoene synthase